MLRAPGSAGDQGRSPGRLGRRDRGLPLLRHEGIFANDYSTPEDVADRLPYFLEEVYNRKRPHSSLGCLPPEEYNCRGDPEARLGERREKLNRARERREQINRGQLQAAA